MTLKLGKKDHVYDSRDIRYADVRPRNVILPQYPEIYGRGYDFVTGRPPGGWGMMGNGPVDDNSLPASWTYAANGGGDCTLADPAHMERMNAKDANRPAPYFSTKTVFEQYIDLTGRDGAAFDPVTGKNDNGLEVRNVLKYRQNEGFYDDAQNRYKIGIYVALEPGNWQMLREAAWLFPGISIGFQVPQSAIDQFSAGKIWSVVPGMMNNVVGGHDVPLAGHAPGQYTSITWAQRQVMTYDFLVKTCDEAWAYVDLERINQVTGETYNGYKEVDLEKYLGMVGTSA